MKSYNESNEEWYDVQKSINAPKQPFDSNITMYQKALDEIQNGTK